MEKMERRVSKLNDEVLKDALNAVLPGMPERFTSVEVADALRPICEIDVNRVSNLLYDMGYRLANATEGSSADVCWTFADGYEVL